MKIRTFDQAGKKATVSCKSLLFALTFTAGILRSAQAQVEWAGVSLWTNRYSNGAAYALAVDGDGNVIVTGGAFGDFLTIKYSNAGVPLWTNRYNGPVNDDDYARAIAVGPRNFFFCKFIERQLRAGFGFPC